jgi:hypothetical protein
MGSLALNVGADSDRIMIAIHARGKLNPVELHRFKKPDTTLPGGSFRTRSASIAIPGME